MPRNNYTTGGKASNLLRHLLQFQNLQQAQRAHRPLCSGSCRTFCGVLSHSCQSWYRWLQPPSAMVWLAKPAYPATQSSQGTHSYISTPFNRNSKFFDILTTRLSTRQKEYPELSFNLLISKRYGIYYRPMGKKRKRTLKGAEDVTNQAVDSAEGEEPPTKRPRVNTTSLSFINNGDIPNTLFKHILIPQKPADESLRN